VRTLSSNPKRSCALLSLHRQPKRLSEVFPPRFGFGTLIALLVAQQFSTQSHFVDSHKFFCAPESAHGERLPSERDAISEASLGRAQLR
jgi:hypothetical protein